MAGRIRSRQDFTSHFIWSAGKDSSAEHLFLGQLSRLWDKLGALEKLRHHTEETDRRRDVQRAACQIVPQSRAPVYLRRPYILSGYLIGAQSKPPKKSALCYPLCRLILQSLLHTQGNLWWMGLLNVLTMLAGRAQIDEIYQKPSYKKKPCLRY